MDADESGQANAQSLARTGADLMRQFVPASPFVAHLGMRLVEIQSDMATLALPYADQLSTAGTTLHGGAIASLIDTAAMAAAWSDAPAPEQPRGATVGLTVSYLAAANGEDLRAIARVLRRGRSLVYVEVDVATASGTAVAKGLVTYKIG
ncbi:MAG: PaaI family thioesterase [Ktedonobacterales bacterium]